MNNVEYKFIRHAPIPADEKVAILSIFQDCGWTTTFATLENLLALTESFIILSRIGSTVVGMCIVIVYETHSFLGYLGTARKFRRRGIATNISRFAIETQLAHYKRPIRLICRPTLVRFFNDTGFRWEQRVQRKHYRPRLIPCTCAPPCRIEVAYSDKHLAAIIDLDEAIFGAGRSQRLRSAFSVSNNKFLFSRRPDGKCCGYALTRANKNGLVQIGPIVATEALVEPFLCHSYKVFRRSATRLLVDCYPCRSGERKDDCSSLGLDICEEFVLMEALSASDSSLRRNSRLEGVYAVWGRASG